MISDNETLSVYAKYIYSLIWGYKITLYIFRVISASTIFAKLILSVVKISPSQILEFFNYSPILNSCTVNGVKWGEATGNIKWGVKISLFPVFNIYHTSHFGDSIKRMSGHKGYNLLHENWDKIQIRKMILLYHFLQSTSSIWIVYFIKTLTSHIVIKKLTNSLTMNFLFLTLSSFLNCDCDVVIIPVTIKLWYMLWSFFM